MTGTGISRWSATLGLLLGTWGCSLWPFAEKERTSHITPAKRVAAIEQLAEEATSAPAQEQAAQRLVEQIQTEPDPLVREAAIRAASTLQTPLAHRMVLAAINDSDPYVRQTACRLAGSRGDEHAIAALGQAAKGDPDLDVRLAAMRALGEFRNPSSVPYLAAGLHDTDPAVQLAAVESLQRASGEDLGNDVSAWRTWVASRQIAPSSPTSLAGRPRLVTSP
jgi:HEAT repeat protein